MPQSIARHKPLPSTLPRRHAPARCQITTYALGPGKRQRLTQPKDAAGAVLQRQADYVKFRNVIVDKLYLSRDVSPEKAPHQSVSDAG